MNIDLDKATIRSHARKTVFRRLLFAPEYILGFTRQRIGDY